MKMHASIGMYIYKALRSVGDQEGGGVEVNDNIDKDDEEEEEEVGEGEGNTEYRSICKSTHTA